MMALYLVNKNCVLFLLGYPPTKIPIGFQLHEITFKKDWNDGLGLSIVSSNGSTSPYFQVSYQ